MRIIAGKARRLPLKSLPGKDTRPTTDRIKETLFNMLAPELDHAYFLDLFAGSGQIGLEAISRGEYMAFGMQGKNIRQQLPQFTPSAMTRIFKRLRVHGLIEKIPGSYKYLITALGKEIIAAGLTIKNLILVPALTS